MDNASPLVDENREVKEQQSAENFQKFIFELFEKNGVINDLRAYLRGHIVNVLKSTQSGETLSCQKHFSQRLELTFQAINILIAEYLLRLEFSYTLSVFVSEIPLANMVFSFARMLMETRDHSELRFKDADVFSILNYIGLKCDSEHANSVVEMYKDNKKTPLLLCILKCLPMYRTDPPLESGQESSSDDTTTSKSSTEKKYHKPRYEKCKHYSLCKTCRNRVTRIKEKYKRKKRNIMQLFQQLKSVYETEMDMMKQEEEKRVKRALVAHAMQLQRKKQQLEATYRAREAELSEAVQKKKRLLWSVARVLKQQHQHMARAMAHVTAEARDLAVKEDNIKTQLSEAETALRQRGEAMRKQISKELSILSNHLESMKIERDNINKERSQLEILKLEAPDTKLRSNHEDLRSHYDLIKDELQILKKYIQIVKLQPKCVTECGTITEINSCLMDNDVLNNRKAEEDVPKRLVNDLKKQKNVNFEQRSLAKHESPQRVREYGTHSRSRSRSSSEAGDAPQGDDRDGDDRNGDDRNGDDRLALLHDENKRLKEIARRQKEHIDSLAWQQARLQAQISSHNITPTRQLPIIPRSQPNTSFTPQTDTTQPINYGTLSANFTPQFNSAQSTTFTPLINFTPGSAFSSQSASFGPQTTNFGTRSAFLTPQSPQSGTFVSQSVPFAVPQANVIQRPRTASPTGRRNIGQRFQPSTSVANLNMGWRVGAGEELSVFTAVGRAPSPARVLLPGDEVPFVGVVGGRHADNKRYLINQWRSLRRRLSPVGGISKRSAGKDKPFKPYSAGPTILSPQNEHTLMDLQPSCSKNDTSHLERSFLNLKSTSNKNSKSDLKPSKEKLKNEDIKTPPIKLEKSPISVLREAKLRLRKLEIEAEAVEKSYLDFRRKRETMKEGDDIKEIKSISSTKTLSENAKELSRPPLSTLDIDKFLQEINTKLDLSTFKNRNSTEYKVNPIPKAYSGTANIDKVFETPDDPKICSNTQEVKKENYLETPLNEFRRFYHSERRLERTERDKSPASKSDSSRNNKNILKQINNDDKELEILKQNLGRIYNMSEHSVANLSSDFNINDNINKIQENINDVVEGQNDDENIYEDKQIENLNKQPNDFDNFNNNMKLIDENFNKLEDNLTVESKDENKNLLRIDVESTNEVNDTQSKESRTQGFVLFVESSVDNVASETENKISTQMTIVVGPKPSPRSNKGEKDIERVDDISKNILEPQYNISDGHISSIQMQLDVSKDALNTTLSELEQNEDPDYPDDFSADVDNYNSNSELRNQSPISLGKTSDDENFWES